jgi:hypothetical protein
MYCGDVAEIIQPLLFIGIKTPISTLESPDQGQDKTASAVPRIGD